MHTCVDMIYIYIYTCMHICIHIYIISIHMGIILVCMCICVQIYVHKGINTHMYMHACHIQGSRSYDCHMDSSPTSLFEVKAEIDRYKAASQENNVGAPDLIGSCYCDLQRLHGMPWTANSFRKDFLLPGKSWVSQLPPLGSWGIHK